MTRHARVVSPTSPLRVDVLEPGTRAIQGWLACKIGEHVRFSTDELSSFCFAKWQPVVFDALLVAAVVEFCDRSLRRATHRWRRDFQVRIPVHDLRRWRKSKVNDALHEALFQLTGDRWDIEFCARKEAQPAPLQSTFDLPTGSRAIVPFSEGMDSRAVAGLAANTLGDRVLRVRLGSRLSDADCLARYGQPFASVPYAVREGSRAFVESSARSRGFKFSTISGLTAYLAKAEQVIVPESGQGSLGPVLVPVGQSYEDYRNHPIFTDMMERYLEGLLAFRPRFEYPRLWYTKGETLKEFVSTCKDGETWQGTWSCWQSARHVSVNGHKRQCGICAACMLRRQSIHAASLTERTDTYVFENLRAPLLEQAVAKGFGRISNALREYAIAGTLHLDHLAALRSSVTGPGTIALCAFQLSRSRALPELDANNRLNRLLSQHELEWRGFMGSLGDRSFVGKWAAHLQ